MLRVNKGIHVLEEVFQGRYLGVWDESYCWSSRESRRSFPAVSAAPERDSEIDAGSYRG